MRAEKRVDGEEIKVVRTYDTASILQTTPPAQEDQTCTPEQYLSLFRSEKIALI